MKLRQTNPTATAAAKASIGLATDLAEIAEAEKRDVAEVAAEFAEPMLPEIFPKDDPVLALALPPETRQEIARLVDGLPAQTFKADDSLGWTYQFWQTDRKKQVNNSEVKIGADELPAVTQRRVLPRQGFDPGRGRKSCDRSS